MRKQRSKR